MVLQPHVRYQLSDGARLYLADVFAVYHRLSNNLEADDETSSETGSESMLAVGNSVAEGTVIVPETPAPSCVKPKNVVRVAESPCSPSESDNSFCVTSPGKSEMFVGKVKELKNHSKWKQDSSDDSVYEADTQCPIDCLDATEHPTSKLHSSRVLHEDRVCENALDQEEEEDMFEAETQCEEPSFRGSIKLFSQSGQKKQDLVIRNETVGAVDNDIYEIKTQCVLDGGLHETMKHDAVSNEKLVPKSYEQEDDKICNINHKCREDHVTAKAVDNTSNKHDDEVHDASTQFLLGDADVTTSAGERGAVDVCSERTKDCILDDGSLNSHFDFKNSVQGKVDVTDSNVLIRRKAIGSGSEMAELHSSNTDVQQKVQLKRQHEKVSCNEDSFDHSLLEGDDEFFTSPEVRTCESEEAASKMNGKVSVIYQEDRQCKSNCTNSSEAETDLLSVSKQCTVKQSISKKTFSVGVAPEISTTNKLSSVQAQNHSGKESDMIEPETPLLMSLSCNNMEAAKLCDESGDETDPDDIFEARTKTILPAVSNRKVISNLSETSFTIQSNRIKPDTQSSTDPGNVECQNEITEKQSKVVESQNRHSGKFITPHDSLKKDAMPSVPKNSVVVSTEKEKTPTQISSEYRDSDDDIYEVPTQILFTPNKNGGITELPESSKDDKTDISTVVSSCSMAVAGQLNCTVGDYENNDSIFEAATQIVKTPNTSYKDFIKPFAFSPVEERKNSACDYVDDDDSIFEAPTQILETPNRSGKEFTKVCSPSPVEEHINCDHDDSDTVSDAPTQTSETQDRGNDGFINASCISSKNCAVSVLMPNDNHKAENFSSSSGNEDPMDLGDKAHAPVMHNVSAERVNYPVNVSTEFKESCTSESRESHVIGDDKEKQENIRHTPQCFEKGFDKCSKRQNTAEVISQKDRNKVAEVVAAKNIFDVTDSGHLNAHEKHEIPVLKEVTPIQHAMPVSVRSSEDQKVSMLGRCTVSATAGTVTLAIGNVNSNNLLKVPPSKYTSETAETISVSTRTSKVNVKHKKIIGQPIDTGKDSELTIPSSQDLANAVRESETTESPFKGEVFIPSEEEEPVPTVKLIRRGHLPSNRAKVRKRLNIKNRSSDTSDESSRRHLPDEGSTDVNVMSKTTAGVSRTGRRRRELHHEVFVHSDISDIQASKNRKLSQKDSLQNDRENMTSDIISIYSTRGCAEDIHQSGTKEVLCMDKERIGRGRKSKAAVMKNKEQVKTVALVEWSGEAKGGRSSKEVTEPFIDECNVPGKIRKEHSINKNEDVEDAVTISSRPSRQRKMTWKVQDSLGSDDSKGSINLVKERPKKRGRGSSSHNSKNLLNENPECNTCTITRLRNVSPTKLPSKKLLKSSVIDTFKEEQKSKQNTFVAPEPDVSQRKSTRQSKVCNAVTSASDISKDQSSQRMTRQNNRKVESNNLQKQKNEETVTEISSGHPKEEEQFFPDKKFQRNITYRCSPKRSKIGLESFKDASSESIIKVSGRRKRQTANVGFVQEPSADITHTNTLSTEGEKPLCFSIGSLQECTGRSVKHRMEVMNTSFPCLKKETASVSLHTSSRTQQGEKRTMLSTDGDVKLLPTKRAKIEKRLTQPHTPSKISVQNDNVKSVPLSRTNRTRGQVSNLQKLETSGTVKQDTELVERENISQISNSEEVNKKLKNEPLTLRSCSINSSKGQDMTPKRASRRGTPQNGIQHNSQKNGSNNGTSTPRRSTPRKVTSSNRTTHQVLFTGFSDTKQESIVRQLGGCVVDLPESCSVLVTDKVRRTYKFLCIVGQGKPIVSPQWLLQSQRSGHFLDPWQYLVKDHESELKFKFRLKESLETAAQTDLLAGYNVYVTPSVKPPPLEMRGIIESCGGVFMTQAATKSWPVSSFIISCMDDKVSWSKLKKSGKPIVGPEVLLLGVLQQNLDLKSNVFV